MSISGDDDSGKRLSGPNAETSSRAAARLHNGRKENVGKTLAPKNKAGKNPGLAKVG